MTLNVLHLLNWRVTDQSAIYNPSRGVEVGKKQKSVSYCSLRDLNPGVRDFVSRNLTTSYIFEERVLPLKLRVKQNSTKMRSSSVFVGILGSRDHYIQWGCFWCLICLCVRCVESCCFIVYMHDCLSLSITFISHFGCPFYRNNPKLFRKAYKIMITLNLGFSHWRK